MAWNSNPVIRDLEPYAKKHGFCMVIAVCINSDGEGFSVNSYGLNAKLCDQAKKVNEQIFNKIKNEEITIF